MLNSELREFALCYARHPGLGRVLSGVGVTDTATDPLDLVDPLGPVKLFRVLCATVSQIRALEVATLAPFGRCIAVRATVTQLRALEVTTFAPFVVLFPGV